MYTISSRLHYVAFQAFMTLAVLACLCHFTGKIVLLKPALKANFEVHSYPYLYLLPDELRGDQKNLLHAELGLPAVHLLAQPE